MIIVAGLGNPGKQYSRNRHNAGFLFLDFLLNKLEMPIDGLKLNEAPKKPKLFIFADKVHTSNFSKRKNYEYRSTISNGKNLVLLKPTTYMNLSGNAILSAMGFYKVGIENLIVIYDDVALPLGKIRIRASGSSGGHNGLKNIESSLGSNQYIRIRIGVGEPEHQGGLITHVLGNFCEEEYNLLNNTIFPAAYLGLETILRYGVNEAMNRINGSDLR